MKKHIYNITLFFILAAIFSSCTEKIDINLGSTYTRLVVDGQITTDTTRHLIHLTQTTDYFYGKTPPPVSGALVTISDGDQVFNLQELSDRPGWYATDSTVYGIPGKTYTLNIQLAQAINDHNSYTASCHMFPVTPMDSISIKYNDRWEIWEVGCYALDPPTVDFYMFKLYKNNILMTDSINKIPISDDRMFNGNYTQGATTGFLRKDYKRERVYPGDKITLELCKIAEPHYKFIMDVQQEVGFNNPLFGGPPSNIKGNVSNGAIGFFAAYSSTKKSCIAK